MNWFAAWRERRQCFHHNHSTAESYIRGQIVDWRKLWTCLKCGKTWLM